MFNFVTDGHEANKPNYFKEDDTYRDDIFSNIIKKNEDFLQLYTQMGGIISEPVFFKGSVICTSMDGTLYCINL